jgi:Zinc finger C-x8-C-x5-C-x3-H type (and similar)
MMPSNKSSARSVRYIEARLAIPDGGHDHLVDAVGYLRPLLPIPKSQNHAVVPALVPLARPRSSVATNLFAPVAPNDYHNDNDNDNDDAWSVKKGSPFMCRKVTASPAFTATTEPMSDASFTSVWSDRESRIGHATSPSSAFTMSSRYSGSPFTIQSRTSTPRKSPDPPKKFPNAAALLQPTRADEDFARKSRIKTEFCMHYQAGNAAKCPFGAGCTFAHSVEELQKTKLIDLERAGLIDSAETYRIKPCFQYVSTGSCPFGKRCAFLHDQRSSGMEDSWLPVTETQGNTIPTDINVESSHQKRLYSILHDNPFGNNFSLQHDEPEHLYQLVANMNEDGRRRQLLDMHKVSIALQMQGKCDWSYKFRPQHIIHGELCMQLQKRAFRLTNTGQAYDIPVDSFDPRSPANVLVREIAFGTCVCL